MGWDPGSSGSARIKTLHFYLRESCHRRLAPFGCFQQKRAKSAKRRAPDPVISSSARPRCVRGDSFLGAEPRRRGGFFGARFIRNGDAFE